MNLSPEFSLRFAELLAALGAKQKVFAASLGISPSHVTELKKGAKPSALLVTAISCVHGVSRVWLERGEGEMFAPGEGNPFLAHKTEDELIIAYQQHIRDLNEQLVKIKQRVLILERQQENTGKPS